MQPGKRNQLSDSPMGQTLANVEKIKMSTRAKVKHRFDAIKKLFGHQRSQVLGLAKAHV